MLINKGEQYELAPLYKAELELKIITPEAPKHTISYVSLSMGGIKWVTPYESSRTKCRRIGDY